MLLLRALLLWSIVSLHVVGGAALFRRLFPRESPWFGFIVPGLALVLALNFIEHLVALPTLVWLLPLTSLGFIWTLAHPQMVWKGFRLPACIFLGSFAFTLTLRCLRPDILGVRDGVVDLGLMSNFCMGEKLPPVFTWYPPLHLSQYYIFGHYAMSVVTRLFGLDVGTGYNLSSALLSAFDCFLAAAAAWRVSRQKIWITILAPILVECAANGAVAYLWCTTANFDPNQANNILTGMDNPANHNPLWKYLHQSLWYDRRELMAPGTWSWIGAFHSTSSGQFLSLFSIWSLTEVLRRRASNWPWICLFSIPLVSLVTSTWALPLEGLFLIGAFFWIWYYKLSPRNLGFVLLALGFVAVALTPMLVEFLTTTAVPDSGWTDPDARTQLAEFLILWWPVYLSWFVLIFTWPKLSPALKTVIIVLPIAFIGMEIYTVGGRPDSTSKLWGYIYGSGWITLFPAVCRRRGFIFRGLTGLLVISCVISFIAWTQYTLRLLVPWDVLHLEGNGRLRADPARGNVLQVLSQMKGETVITGRSWDMYAESPVLASFTGTRTYVSWSFFCDAVAGGNTYGQADQRGREVNDLFDGKCANPLLFLRNHDIAALVIYSRDNIKDDVLAGLKKQLAPYYEYKDFRKDDPANAGIFVFHPELLNWPPGVLLPPPAVSSPPATNAPPAKPVSVGP